MQWKELRNRRTVSLVLAAGLVAGCARDEDPMSPGRLKPGAAHRTSYVISSGIDDGAGSLRAAIAAAQDGDVIQISPSLAGGTIAVSSGPLVISHSITIAGPTTGTRVKLVGSIPCSLGDIYCTPSVVNVSVGVTATLRDLMITGGTGRGISNSGTLTVENTTISGGQSTAKDGAGILNAGTLTLVNSSIWGNTGITFHDQGSGGGTGGTDNVANGAGLAQIGSASSATLIHSSIMQNSATGTGGGVYIAGGRATFHNSIIASNTAPTLANCSFGPNATITLLGTSLSSDETCGAANSTMLVATNLGPTTGIDAVTGGLSVLPGSPAINAAPDCPVATDQRLVARPQPVGGACDIGAYEFDQWTLVNISNAADGTVDNKTGVALVNGTVTCSSPQAIVLDVSLVEAQKAGRVNVNVQASAPVSVNCGTAPTPWITFLTPVNGAFKNGAGTLSVTVHDPAPTLAVTGSTSTVKLYWSK